MDTLTFITGNPQKAKALGRYLSYPIAHKTLDIPEIQSLDHDDVAAHKAQAAFNLLDTPVLVEDTALTFTAIAPLPGPLIKWFLTAIGNDGMAHMLNGYEDRSARAEVCFALCDENGVLIFKGGCEGSIAPAPRGDNGWGWDPIFIPQGHTKTWAEMSNEEQDKTSMRKIALDKLQAHLELQ